MGGANAVEPAPRLVRIALVSPELGDLGPLTLRVGQRLLAEVLSVQAETGRTILSLAGRRVEAQVPTGLRQGEIVRLAVAEALPDRLVFRVEPEGLEVPALTARSVAVDAGAVLAELDLPDTPVLRAAVGALVEQQAPLARETLLQIRSALAPVAGEPALNARAAVVLRQAGIPLTRRGVGRGRTPFAMPGGVRGGERPATLRGGPL